jgi:nucleoside-diphosphate-sugar epimerase
MDTTTSSSKENLINAIVIGGTGATGKKLIHQLLNNDNCRKVTSIGRKLVIDGNKHDKLVDVIVDSLFDLSSTKEHWNNHDVFFNCLGTTRKRAGSAQAFVDIESGISKEASKMASQANISHASLISAKGANHEIWATNWIHPLLYMKTMGQKEQTIISDYSFNTVSIFKPGMLIRFPENKHFFERIVELNGSGLNVDILASAMIQDAENVKSSFINGSQRFFIGNESIKNLTKN